MFKNKLIFHIYDADNFESFCNRLEHFKSIFSEAEEMIRNFLHDEGVELSPEESQLLHEEMKDGRFEFLFSLKKRLPYEKDFLDSNYT